MRGGGEGQRCRRRLRVDAVHCGETGHGPMAVGLDPRRPVGQPEVRQARQQQAARGGFMYSGNDATVLEGAVQHGQARGSASANWPGRRGCSPMNWPSARTSPTECSGALSGMSSTTRKTCLRSGACAGPQPSAPQAGGSASTPRCPGHRPAMMNPSGRLPTGSAQPRSWARAPRPSGPSPTPSEVVTSLLLRMPPCGLRSTYIPRCRASTSSAQHVPTASAPRRLGRGRGSSRR